MNRAPANPSNRLLRWSTLLVVLGLALLNANIYGQGTGTGSILGTVTDPSGAVVPNAKITITNLDNGFVRTTTSNATGNFSAPELPVGHYQLRVEVQGFKTYQLKNISLNVTQTMRLNPVLQIGTASQSVTVEADAIQVQSDTSDVSQTISANDVQNLPTNGRNILQLTTLVPGAASNMPDFDSPGAQFQNRSVYFNGMRQDANNWQIDGGEAYDRGGGGILLVSPSQNALQEFTVQTSNYAADEGESSGGMVSMEVKSGTKRFHGSAWEFDRNDALDAVNYFQKKKAELRYNAFGFNAGGPVEFKSSNPKTFFFYNMEWRREINGGAIHNLAPNAAEYAGDESAMGHIYVPMTTDQTAIAKFQHDGLQPGQEFQYNGKMDVIPPDLIDSNAAAYIKAGYLLPPNDPTGQYYNSVANTTTNYREEIVRMDHQFNQKFSLMGHFIYDSLSQAAPIVAWTGNTFPTIGSLETVPSWQGVVRLTYNISSNMLNELAYNENGNDITLANSGLATQPSGWNAAPLFPTVNSAKKIPSINISGGPIGVAMSSGNWPWQNWWRSDQIKDDLSWIHGRHNMKFGFAWMWTNKKQQIFVNTAGNYDFNGNASGCSTKADPTYCTTSTNGIGLADFLLGDADNFNQPALQDFVSITNLMPDAYAMDNWRITRRLTLDIGLRWEYDPHAYDTNNRLGNFYPNLYNPANAPQFLPGSNNAAMNTSGPGFETVSGIKLSTTPFYMNGIGLAGRNGIPRGLVDNHWATFAPRLGFAYDLFGDGKTILRGGFGMFYERNAGNEEYNMGADPPFVNTASTFNPYLDNPAVSYQNGQGAGTAPTTPQGFTGLQQSLPMSTIYQFNMGLQHQLRNNMVATLAFVGNTSAHLSQTVDINTLAPGDIADRTAVCGAPCGASSQANANYYRQYLGFSDINQVYDQGNAHYEGLQATFRASAWKDLYLNAAYTYSHAFDVIDAQLFNNLDDPMNPGYTYGTSGFDRRHIFVSNLTYNLPIFAHSNGLANHLAGGWTTAAIITMQSGNPLTVDANSPNTLGFGGGTVNHANISGKVSYPHTVQQYFSPSVFSYPTPLQWGNAPKSIVKGPGEDHWTMSLYKDFKFTERSGLQFRADAFNTWNHATFNAVNTGVLTGNANNPISPTAGALTGTGDPREFQFGATLYF
jgi:hypothetical protein